MADPADEASDFIDQELARQIAAAKNQARPAKTPVGTCHHCGEKVDKGMIFCDADCRDDFDREEQRRR
jgi:hypothetical protein